MIIDILIVLALAVFVFIGTKRGFIKEAVSLVSIVIAALLAFWIADIGSKVVYDSVIEEKAHSTLTEAIGGNADDFSDSAGQTFNDIIPDELTAIAQKIGIKFDLSEKIDVSSEKSAIIESAVGKIMTAVVKPICTKVVAAVIFVVAFIILIIVIRLIARALNIIAKLPVLKSLNSLLGGVVGLLKGAVIILAVCYCLYLNSSLSGDGIWNTLFLQFSQSKIWGIII